MEGLAPPQEAAAAPAGADIASLIAEEVSAPHCCTPLSNGMAVAQPAYGGRHRISCAAGAGEKSSDDVTGRKPQKARGEAGDISLHRYHGAGVPRLHRQRWCVCLCRRCTTAVGGCPTCQEAGFDFMYSRVYNMA